MASLKALLNALQGKRAAILVVGVETYWLHPSSRRVGVVQLTQVASNNVPAKHKEYDSIELALLSFGEMVGMIVIRESA